MSKGATPGLRLAGCRIGPLSFTVMVVVMLVLGSAFMAVGCSSSGSQDDGDGTASDELYALAGHLIEAMNGTYKGDVADLYAEDAVFDDRLFHDQYEGRDEIVQVANDMVANGATFGLSGKPLQVGDYLIQPVIFLGDGEPTGQGVHVFRVNADNLVTHQWLSGKLSLEH